ncbi:hypothetical protein [Nocardia sp. NPDC005366]|uniref:hypothetical protein n=1 Tax=Nocardia sp. NPDC005366 TaxID=3156878 RepID=UPI0033ADEAFA
MSYFSIHVSGLDGIAAEYRPERESELGFTVPAAVDVVLCESSSYLHLSIEDARMLAEQLPAVLAEHDAAVAASAVKAA